MEEICFVLNFSAWQWTNFTFQGEECPSGMQALYKNWAQSKGRQTRALFTLLANDVNPRKRFILNVFLKGIAISGRCYIHNRFSSSFLKCIVETVETNSFVNIQTVVSCRMNAQMSRKKQFWILARNSHQFSVNSKTHLNEDSNWRQCNNCCHEKRIPNTQNNFPFISNHRKIRT